MPDTNFPGLPFTSQSFFFFIEAIVAGVVEQLPQRPLGGALDPYLAGLEPAETLVNLGRNALGLGE